MGMHHSYVLHNLLLLKYYELLDNDMRTYFISMCIFQHLILPIARIENYERMGDVSII